MTEVILDRHTERILCPYRGYVRDCCRFSIAGILALSQTFSGGDMGAKRAYDRYIRWHYIAETWAPCTNETKGQIGYDVQKRGRELVLKICNTDKTLMTGEI